MERTSRADVNTIQTEFNAAVRAKREGKSADFVRAVDKDSDITIDIIGANGQVLELEVPSRHVVEQIVSKTGLPPWTLGLQWSTTERLADNQAEVLLADISTRQAAKLPHFYNLVRTLLLLRGRTWKKGDWKLEWAQVNLRDVLKQAQARFMNAQADMYDRQNAIPAPQVEVKTAGRQEKTSRCGYEGEKQEKQRPKPWPALDTVETEYEDRLKDDWADLKNRVFTILGFNGLNGSNHLNGACPRVAGINSSTKDEIGPTVSSFVFSDEQRAAIMKAMRDTVNIYNIADPDSPVRWYYGQSYSLGLIQAARLLGKSRPILDIIKNKEIYDELCRSGFALVKDNATKAIVQGIIPEMEVQMLAGTNPRHLAARLKSLFEGQNSDWERLARTEMSMAAEIAKLDEWQEWKVEMVEFTPAPDACPTCIALAADYPIAECPIPGADTHPRCRCSTRPAESKT